MRLFFCILVLGGISGFLAEAAEVDLTESHRLRVSAARTVEMEFAAWAADAGGSPETRKMEAAGADGIPNIWKFALETAGPKAEIRGSRVTPHWVRVEADGGFFYGLEFTRKREPEWSRISYFLERRIGEGDWETIAEPAAVRRAAAGNGWERVVLSDGIARGAEERPEFRLRVELEPRRTFFVHYMSDLNPGWKAMAFVTTPMPAYFRLFHDRPERMRAPAGPDEFFQSTGGVNRDLPLVPPGFAFGSGKESAMLEIRRARRAGVDGFAVNCLSGKTDFLEDLFEAAAEIRRKEGGEPFQVGLSLDINVLPHEDGRLLVAVADLIGSWLELGKGRERSVHLARRGGLPMAMGYQSNWIWIDYLHRLLEVWEWERGFREENPWAAEFGARPEKVELPETVEKLYADLRADGKSMEEVRHRAVRNWANLEDGWRYIRPAYRLVEKMVGREIFWQFDAIEMDAMTENLEGAMRVVAREFPAVGMFLPKGKATEIVRRVTHEEGAEWGEPIFSQYVAYGQNEQDGFFLGNFRDTVATERMREGWYRAIGRNLETGETAGAETSSLLQYTTWNDFNEHSHIAPSLGLRYSLTELTGRLAEIWKAGGNPKTRGEEAFLFYRKYPEWAAERSFPFPHKGDYKEAAFEAVTILREAAVLELWGERRGKRFLRTEPVRVEAGFRVTRFAGEEADLWAEGKVGLRVRMDSERELEAVGWEEITHRPFRQDVSLAGASSRCDALWTADFSERGMRGFRFAEYGDADGDGLPNWFEMLYFGRGWLDWERQTAADPDGDENGDGMRNAEHFRDGTNPFFFAEAIPFRRDEEGRKSGRSRRSGRVTIQAEDFDLGGLGVGYWKAEARPVGIGDYRQGNEIAPHKRVDGHEMDAGDWMLTDLADGDWFSYTVAVDPGCYVVSARVRGSGGWLAMELDGETVARAEIDGRDLWSTRELGRIQLPAGEEMRRFRLRFENPGFDLNWVRLDRCR